MPVLLGFSIGNSYEGTVNECDHILRIRVLRSLICRRILEIPVGVGTFVTWLASRVAPASSGLSLSRSR